MGWMGWDGTGWDLSQTTTTTRAPLAVLTKSAQLTHSGFFTGLCPKNDNSSARGKFPNQYLRQITMFGPFNLLALVNLPPSSSSHIFDQVKMAQTYLGVLNWALPKTTIHQLRQMTKFRHFNTFNICELLTNWKPLPSSHLFDQI